jgi:pathogenesis-related protein 1
MRPLSPALLALPLVTLSACSSGSSSAGDTEPASMAGITALHNDARAAVKPAASPTIPPLTWSGTVSAAAQSWADSCEFSHDTGGYGQNIYARTADSTPTQVVGAWVAEAANYDYATNTCASGDVCGHYTQVVWRDSTELGCGLQSCTANSPFGGGSWQIWVCNYSPPGNFEGQKPY